MSARCFFSVIGWKGFGGLLHFLSFVFYALCACCIGHVHPWCRHLPLDDRLYVESFFLLCRKWTNDQAHKLRKYHYSHQKLVIQYLLNSVFQEYTPLKIHVIKLIGICITLLCTLLKSSHVTLWAVLFKILRLLMTCWVYDCSDLDLRTKERYFKCCSRFSLEIRSKIDEYMCRGTVKLVRVCLSFHVMPFPDDDD